MLTSTAVSGDENESFAVTEIRMFLDLYGDENEFAVPTEQDNGKTEDEPSAKPATPAASTAVAAPAKYETPPPKIEERDASAPSLPNGNAPQPIQSYSSSPQDYSARRPDQDFHAGGLNEALQPIQSSLPIIDRHVRPSEMKEEG